MVVKIICYLNRIVYSFIANLDAVNFFAPFSCYIDIFLMSSQVLKRFSLFSWKKLLKWLALLFLVKLSIYFLYVLTLFTSSSLFNGLLVQHIFLESPFFVSIDMSRPLVTQGLFCNKQTFLKT